PLGGSRGFAKRRGIARARFGSFPRTSEFFDGGSPSAAFRSGGIRRPIAPRFPRHLAFRGARLANCREQRIDSSHDRTALARVLTSSVLVRRVPHVFARRVDAAVAAARAGPA